MSLAKSKLLLRSQFHPRWAKAVTDLNASLGQNGHRFDPLFFRTNKVVAWNLLGPKHSRFSLVPFWCAKPTSLHDIKELKAMMTATATRTAKMWQVIFAKQQLFLTWTHTFLYCTSESTSGQGEVNPSFWLAYRAGKLGSSCPLGISHVGSSTLYLPGLFYPGYQRFFCLCEGKCFGVCASGTHERRSLVHS